MPIFVGDAPDTDLAGYPAHLKARYRFGRISGSSQSRIPDIRQTIGQNVKSGLQKEFSSFFINIHFLYKSEDKFAIVVFHTKIMY
jgi:hypothetical protein